MIGREDYTDTDTIDAEDRSAAPVLPGQARYPSPPDPCVYRGIIGRMVKALGEEKLSLYGFVGMVVGYGLLGFATNLWMLLVLVAIGSLGISVVRPSLTTLLTKSVERTEHGARLLPCEVALEIEERGSDSWKLCDDRGGIADAGVSQRRVGERRSIERSCGRGGSLLVVEVATCAAHVARDRAIKCAGIEVSEIVVRRDLARERPFA